MNNNIEALDEFLQQMRTQILALYAAGEDPKIVVVVRRPHDIYIMGNASIMVLDREGSGQAAEQIRTVLAAAMHSMMFNAPKRVDRSDQSGIDLR